MINFLSKGYNDPLNGRGSFYIRISKFFSPCILYQSFFRSWIFLHLFSLTQTLGPVICSVVCHITQNQQRKTPSDAWSCWGNFWKTILERGFIVRRQLCFWNMFYLSLLCRLGWPTTILCRFMGQSWLYLPSSFWCYWIHRGCDFHHWLLFLFFKHQIEVCMNESMDQQKYTLKIGKWGNLKIMLWRELFIIIITGI